MSVNFLQRPREYLELTRGQYICLLLVVAGQLSDIVTTGLGMVVFGTQEGNPFSIALITHFGLLGYFMVKFILVVSAVLFSFRFVNRVFGRHPKRFRNQALGVLIVLIFGGWGIFVLSVSALNLWVGLGA